MRTGSVDREAILDRIGGSRELLEEVTGMYADVRPALLDQIHAAIEAGDADTVCREAHRLKGTFGALEAEKALAICARIVDHVRSNNYTAAREELDHLTAEARKVEDELRAIDAQEWGEPVGTR